LVLVEWFHQKDYPLHAKVGASGSMKCQQLIGGTIPPGSRGAPSKRRMYVCWQCWSSALLIHFKPIAAGGMVPTTNWIQRWGPQEAQNASSSLVELFHLALEVHLQRGGCMLAVLVSSSANIS